MRRTPNLGELVEYRAHPAHRGVVSGRAFGKMWVTWFPVLECETDPVEIVDKAEIRKAKDHTHSVAA